MKTEASLNSKKMNLKLVNVFSVILMSKIIIIIIFNSSAPVGRNHLKLSRFQGLHIVSKDDDNGQDEKNHSTS